jgi:Cobalamin synthesis protein cobW C-terminal domain
MRSLKNPSREVFEFSKMSCRESQLRYIFQLSGKRINIDSSEWNAPPKTQLVWIGRNLNLLDFQQRLNNCFNTASKVKDSIPGRDALTPMRQVS